MQNISRWRVGIVGYGEVGRILAEDLRAIAIDVQAYDIQLAQAQSAAALSAHAHHFGVSLTDSHTALAAGCELVISAVTASQAVDVAAACAPGMKAGAFFLDFNSASPQAKQQGAQAIATAGGRFVEGAVMASVPPYRIKAPLLLGGPDALALAPALESMGFNARIASAQLGVASATKLCRSVIIKGLESIFIESLTAARHYGVEDAVLASLGESFPQIDWQQQASYFFQRVIEHGQRRSEEMQQAAHTVRAAGLSPDSAAATAQAQARVAHLAAAGVFGHKGDTTFARNADWRTEADRILASLKEIP